MPAGPIISVPVLFPFSGVPPLAKRAPAKKTGPHALRVELARNLRRYRDEAGLSQRDLAERSGVTQKRISLLENGRLNATIDTINALARALGIDPRDLAKS